MRVLKDIANIENFFIDVDLSLKEAMEQMRQNPDGSVVLLGEKKPIAILTESDIVNALGKEINLGDKAYHFATKKVITANENRPIDFAFNFLSEHNIRRVVLVDDDGKFAGIVLQEDLFDYLEEDVYKVDLQISHIKKDYGETITVTKDASLFEGLELMKKHHIGSIIVMDEGQFVGILTEKDILKLTYMEVNMSQKIEAYMSSPVYWVDEKTLVTDVIALMKIKKIRRILVTDDTGKLLSILTNRDILKQIKGNYSRILQIKIKHAQEIMDFLPEAILEVFDGGGNQVIHWMNKRAKELFGESLIDKELVTVFSQDDWESIYRHFKSNFSLVNKRVHIGNLNFEVSGTLSKNLHNRYIKLIFKDVTEHETAKRRLQEEIDKQIEKRLENEYLLMQQSKLATMGEMIGHIAHQWRQPLAQLGGVFMNLDAAYEFEDMTPEYFKKKVKNGNELIKYMSHTIDDFRHFFEPNRTKERFDVEKYIQSAINIITASLTYHHISLEFRVPKSSLFVSGYPSEFSQVILNLLDNAKDILLERAIENPHIMIVLREHDSMVYVEVIDNAGGVEEEIMESIFDIYFTTKLDKGGSGLGLYMSKLILESKEVGTLSVHNEKKGACFTITMQKG